MQLLQSRPELTGLLKGYLAQQMRAAGVLIDQQQITNAMLYSRIQKDPQFAEGASQWLLALTADTSRALQTVPEIAGNKSEPTGVSAPPAYTEPQAGSAIPTTIAPQPAESATVAQTGSLRIPAEQATLGPNHPASVTTPSIATTSSAAPEVPALQVKSLPKYLLQDQKAFWTLPFHLHTTDLAFIVPATFGTAILIGSDTAIEKHLPTSSNTVKMAANGSTAGMAALVGVGGGLFLWGSSTHDEHARETGFLVGEAAIDAYAASTALQYITQRERPFTGNGNGNFFYGGSSFPSDTAAVSWAAASVLAHEYPGFLTKLLAYGVAGGVSAGRVIGQKHWTSDAVIGSALGWYMGRQIYRARSRGAEIDASKWGTFEKSPEQEPRDPAYMGTTFVPLDSWVYPAMERLEALGYLPTLIQALKPWARMDCARLTLEAESSAENLGSSDPAATQTISDLRREFAIELANLEGGPNVGAEMESAYVRFEPIAGRPLYDGYHFAQTLYNDFGRPYGEGLNLVAGISGRAEAGPLAFYVRGEYQHSASMPNYSPELAQTITSYDPLPPNSVSNFNSVNRVRLLDAYVALNIANWELSAGQQSLWWGHDYGGSLMMSTNAQPMPMLRVGRVVPYRLPGILEWLGEIKNTFFIGSMKGVTYLRGPYPEFPLIGNGYQIINPQPYTWGDKLALKMTANFEIGVTISTLWAGSGRPATLETWLHSFSSNGNQQRLDPGKRYTGANFSYRVPWLRGFTFYADGMANDQPNPVAYVRKSAWNPGIYLPSLPLFPKLDLRVEGIYTNVPNYPGLAPYYNNARYAQGYTLYNQIIGSWVGRQGSAIQAWSTYWFSPQKKIQAGYRRQWNDPVFEQGGGLTDVSTNVDWLFKREIQFSLLAQYERWNFPELSSWVGGPMPRNNFTLGMQLAFWPLHDGSKEHRAFVGTR